MIVSKLMDLVDVAVGGYAIYGLYKHITVANVKAEIAKIEGEILQGTLAAEAKAIVARIKVLL